MTCLVIGWSGAISHMVRAIATAVKGLFEGVLMMQSLRVKAFLTMASAALPPPFPGIIVQRAGTEGPYRRHGPVREGRVHPTVEVVPSDLLVRHLADSVTVKNRPTARKSLSMSGFVAGDVAYVSSRAHCMCLLSSMFKRFPSSSR